MRRFPAHADTQYVGCCFLFTLLRVDDGVLRIREIDCGELVCSALRIHVANAEVANGCCKLLYRMLQCGLASFDLSAAASLAADALHAHHLNADIRKSASDLTTRLLAHQSEQSVAGVSPERAALNRVDELEERRDFASLVRNMDAFPECEELQQAGCNAIFCIVDDGRLAKEAAASGAVECVIRALDLFRHSADTQRMSLNALNALIAPQVEAILCVAGNAGAVQLAVRALRSFPENARVITAAFYVIGHLAGLRQCCEEAIVLSVGALRRCAKHGNVQGAACGCLARLCGFDALSAAAADALSMGAMELALTALRAHRAEVDVCANASVLLKVLCLDEDRAVKAKQLGAPALLQAVTKAHLSDEGVQKKAAAALARIQRFVDAACARADAKMAELIAGEEAAKGSSGGAAPKKAGKGKGKGGEGAAAGWIPPPAPPRPSVGADGEPALTKAQIKRRKAKAAAAARKAVSTSDSAAVGEEEEEEEGSDASSGDSEPPRSRPPIDFSKDAEFRRRLPPITNSPLAISPELLAASDAILAAHAALYAPNPTTQPGAEGATPKVMGPAREEEGTDTPDGAPLAELAAAHVAASPSPTAPQPASVEPARDPPASAPPPRGTDALSAAVGTASPATVPPSAAACSSPSCAAHTAALVAEMGALRAELAALRARVAALEDANRAGRSS